MGADSMILPDRNTLAPELLALVEKWDADPQANPLRASGKVLEGDDREARIREWATAEWERTQPDTSRRGIRAQLRADWDAMGEQYPWIAGPYRTEFEAVNALLDEGRDEQAAQLIEHAEPKPSFSAEQVAAFEAVKAQFSAGVSGMPSS